MAQFNPQIPDTNDPNYLYWSRPISEPKPDTSTAAAIEAGTDALGGALKVADYSYKSIIEDKAAAGVDALRDAQTKGLEQTDIATKVAYGLTGKPVQPLGALDAIGKGDQAPMQIAELDNNLATLNAAKGNGKLSNTAYTGRLVSLIKDLRSQYPGYRDFIDQTVEKYSGINAANKYMEGLVSDINSFVTAGREEQNKWRNVIVDAAKEGIPGAPQMLQLYESGRVNSTDILKWMAPVQEEKLRWAQAKGRYESQNYADKDLERQVSDDVTKLTYGIASNHFNTMNIIDGVDTPQKMMEAVQKAAANPGSMNENIARSYAARIIAMKNMAYKEAWDQLNSAKAKDGRSVVSVIGGPEKAQAMIKAQVDPIYDNIANLITNQQYGPAFEAMNTVKSLTNEATKSLLTDKEMGSMFLMGKAVAGMGNDTFTKNLFESFLVRMDESGGKYKEWFKNKTLKMVTQPDAAFGNPTTLKQIIDEGKAKEIVAPKSYDQLVTHIERIADPNTPMEARTNLAKAVFTPEGLGLMSRFEKDGYDPTTGRQKPGQYSVYNRLTKPDMTKAMFDLGQKVDPAYWQNYKDWAKLTFGRELMGGDLKDLSKLGSIPGIVISWNDQANRFDVTHGPANPKEPFPARPTERYVVDRTINKINGALANLSVIAKQENSDVSAYLWNTMRELGVTTDKVLGIPADMMRAIQNSKQQREETGSKYKATPSSGKLNYNEENAPSSGNLFPNGQGASLSDWLVNPAGRVAAQRQNAPATLKTAPRGTSRRSINLSDQGPIMGIQTTDVPEGANLNDYLRQ